MFKQKMGVMREYYRTPNNISLIATVKGKIKEDDLRDVLGKILKIHPLTGVRVFVDHDNDAWFTNEDAAPIPLKIITRRSKRQCIEIVEKEHEIPFDFNKGPLIRFILLKSEEISDIIIICQHSISDGLSLTNLLQDVMYLLNQPQKSIKKVDPVFPTIENFRVPLKMKLKLLKNRIIMSRINHEWDKQPVIFDDEDYQNVHEAYFKKFQYKIVNVNLSRQETSNLIKKCHEQNVTVNSALSIALLAGRNNVKNVFLNEDSVIQIAVNIRNQLKNLSPNFFGFLASGFKIEFKYQPDITFWDNVRIFHQKVLRELKINRALENLVNYNTKPTLTDAINFAMYGKWVSNDFSRFEKISNFIMSNNQASKISKKLITNMPVLMMSNLGPVKTTNPQTPLTLDRLYFITSSSPYLELVSSVVTANGKLTLTLSYMEPRNNSGYKGLEINKIVHNAMDQLKTGAD